MREVDTNATMIATTRYGLPRCLHIPIAARDVSCIERYIGKAAPIFAGDKSQRAVRVELVGPEEMDETLVVWDMPGATVLHLTTQVWVHVDYRAYRRAYAAVFPEEDISSMVIDHVRNRRVARVMGFQYVRLVPVTRGVNTSSGGLSEKWEVEHQSKPSTRAWHAANPTFIQYADIGDIAKMLGMQMENELHGPVNILQRRLREERR